MSTPFSRTNAASACLANTFLGLYSLTSNEDITGLERAINTYIGNAGLTGVQNFWMGAQLQGGTTWANDNTSPIPVNAAPSSTDVNSPCLEVSVSGGILTFAGADCSVSKMSVCDYVSQVPTTTTSNEIL